jgi:hypothetical protein
MRPHLSQVEWVEPPFLGIREAHHLNMPVERRNSAGIAFNDVTYNFCQFSHSILVLVYHSLKWKTETNLSFL